MVCMVSGVLKNLSGEVLPNTEVVFTRRGGVVAQEGAVVVPYTQSALSDGSGVLAVSLFAGEYDAHVDGCFAFRVGVPEADTASFPDLIGQYPDVSPSVLFQAIAASDAAIAAADRAEAVGMFDTRADLVAWISAGNVPVSGREYRAGGLSYIGATGATAISDLPGLLPPALSVRLEQFGSVSGDCAATWTAAMDYLESAGGGTIDLVPGPVYSMTPVTFASNVTLQMNGATLAVHSSTPKTGAWLQNRNISGDGTRACIRPQIIGPGTIDGSARPFDRWLSKLDGTPITDPEADYVMSSGALASGISGVDLTAVLSGDAVASVTINNGGAGWNGHPTHPYAPNTVPLRFEGDGSGAVGFATISGGTISSVTISSGGYGYTVAPTVTTMGGYANISLLAEPSVDRRNPNYEASGDGVYFGKAQRPKIEGVTFRGFRCRVVLDAGCAGGLYRNIEFVDCGKDDGPFHCFWVQSFGTPGAGLAFYAPSTGTLIENIRATDGIERSLALFAPAGGGTMRNAAASGCGESTVFIPHTVNYDGGSVLIDGCDFSDNCLTDIAAQLIEHGEAKNLTVRNTRLSGSAFEAVSAVGCTNANYEGCTFENNVTILTKTNDSRTPFGPFSERYGFNIGQRPVAGNLLNIEVRPVVSIGSLGSEGSEGVSFKNNTFSENRLAHPSYLFAQTKSGFNNIAGDTLIEGNDILRIPPTMALLDTSVSAVWLPTMPLHIRGNRGHASEAPVIVSQTINAAGLYTISPGFRPSRVEVFAATGNPTRFRTAIGSFSWTRSGVRNDFVLATSTDNASEYAFIYSTDVIRVVTPAGVNSAVVEFSSWTETGFVLNCVTYSEVIATRFVCHP